MPQRKLIPDVVDNQELVCVAPTVSVKAAVRLMSERGVSAVLVTEGRVLKGIFTERDLTTRVVAADRDPYATQIQSVMTAAPETLRPDSTVLEALTLMETRRCRHLPIVADDGAAVGMVSIRDLFAAVRAGLEEEIRDRDAFMFGDSYSAAAHA